MNGTHLGDSYDLVKQCLLRALGGLGGWEAHPMLTAPFDDAEEKAYRQLLRVDLLSLEVLGLETDRSRYFDAASRSTRHVFLDPDTGIQLDPIRGKRAPAYIFGPELVRIARRSDKCLTLTFDQSLTRGKHLAGLQAKLVWLAARGLCGFAYCSHASFVVIGQDRQLVGRARGALVTEGGLPDRMLTPLNTPPPSSLAMPMK